MNFIMIGLLLREALDRVTDSVFVWTL